MKGKTNTVKQFFSDDMTAALPTAITRAASKQTYYTILLLVDRERITNAYRTYAYFRWVDDWLDTSTHSRSEKIGFINRQQALIDGCYEGEIPSDVPDEEQMIVDLIRSDSEQKSRLQAYIRNMMAVMTFDAKRQGHLISLQELTDYSHHLAVAVTEAMHYFIGHDDPSIQSEARYAAATAAHITHMLRDTYHDLPNGYFNIPREWVESYEIDPCAPDSEPYRTWVKSRVQLARTYFQKGRMYLAQVKNFRCRLAAYLYMARFEQVLDSIEQDDYQLRADYHEFEGLLAVLTRYGAIFPNALGLTSVSYD